MTELRVVSVAELKPVLDELNGLSWPVAFEEFPAIFDRLGWQVQYKGGGTTSLPVSKPMVAVGKLGDELSRLWFPITDSLVELGPANDAILKDAFDRVTEVVSECMGFGPTGTPWVDPGLVWDLPDGRQVRLLSGDRSIELLYWSKRMADIERQEQSRGVDPSHNLEDRE